MAIIKKQVVRLEHPEEEGVWVDLRLPLQFSDTEQMRQDSLNKLGMLVEILPAMIEAWSYDEPVTTENVRALDMPTGMWLAREVFSQSGLRDDDEKNALEASSSLTTDQDMADSQLSSAI